MVDQGQRTLVGKIDWDKSGGRVEAQPRYDQEKTVDRPDQSESAHFVHNKAISSKNIERPASTNGGHQQTLDPISASLNGISNLVVGVAKLPTSALKVAGESALNNWRMKRAEQSLALYEKTTEQMVHQIQRYFDGGHITSVNDLRHEVTCLRRSGVEAAKCISSLPESSRAEMLKARFAHSMESLTDTANKMEQNSDNAIDLQELFEKLQQLLQACATILFRNMESKTLEV